MSTSREAYEALVNAGIEETTARRFIENETGEDPVGIESVTVTFTLTVEVELERDDVEDLQPSMEDEIIQRAEDKLDIDTYGVSLTSVDSAEVSNVNLVEL